MKLEEFMNNVEILGKEFAIYTDKDKGVSFPLNTVHLLARVDYLELTKEEYAAAKFGQKIEDLDYNVTNVKKPVPKNEITGKDEDKYTITEKEVAVRQVWNVSNTAGAFKSYTNKDEAMEKAREINNKIFEYLK
jgi:hypothetical protein